MWAPEGLPLVNEFAKRFYGVSYQTWEVDTEYLVNQLVDGYALVFLKQYFPPNQEGEMRAQKEVHLFTVKQAGKVVRGQGERAIYRVEGQLTVQSLIDHMPKTLSDQPVAMEIAVKHVVGLGYRVEKVTEITPQTAGKSGQPSGTSGQASDPAVKFVGDAAGEAAKKILGL